MTCPHEGVVGTAVCPSCGMVVRALAPAPVPVLNILTAESESFEPFTFFVPGVPITQGSMRIFNGKVVHDKSKELMAWRKSVVKAAEGIQRLGSQVPVSVDVTFYIPRPASVRRNLPSVRPDLDKLFRALGDGLGDCVLTEDGQVVEWAGRKRYADDCPVGTLICLSPSSVV